MNFGYFITIVENVACHRTVSKKQHKAVLYIRLSDSSFGLGLIQTESRTK